MKKILSFIWKWRWALVCLIAAGANAFVAGADYDGWAIIYTVSTFVFGFGFGIELCQTMGREFRASLFRERDADE
jgi:hypothetical protein